MPVKIALLNNEYLGMVRQQQQVQYKGNLVEVDLARRARLHQAGAGLRHPGLARDRGRVSSTTRSARRWPIPGPAIIEFRVARTEDVYPWVLGGTSLGEVLPDTPYEDSAETRAGGRRPKCKGCERPMSKHTLVATVEEGPVVLNRVLSLFRQRSFAIESLSIGRTNEPGIMRLTMVVDGAEAPSSRSPSSSTR